MSGVAPRGQALVETALGVVLVVTILIFGIHFAEIGYLSLKVTEANNFALWDATGRQTHRYTETGELNSGPRSTAVSQAETRAGDLYRDYDGTTGGTGAPPTQVFTRAGPITTRCGVVSGVGMLPDLDMTSELEGVNLYRNADEGGLRCSARARLNLINAGRFLEGSDGLFREDQVSRTTYTICAINRASGGSCDGEVLMALGDFSFSAVAGNEAAECDLYDCRNTRYRAAVRKAFDVVSGANGAASALASAVVGASPVDEGEFWFSFKGEENNFQQTLGGVHAGEDRWTVTPGGPGYEAVPVYGTAYGQRTGCWLGLPCNWAPRPP